jgi:hypothetical protein
MKLPRRFALSLAACLAAGTPLFVTTPATAAVVVPLSREALVAESDLVVRATVLGRKSGWNAERTQIQTWTTLRVDEYLKGQGSREIVLRQLGGEVDGLVTEISGDGHVLPGEQAVLFLRRGDGVVFLTALAQAVYLVTTKGDGVATAQRDLAGLSFARWVGGRMQTVEAAREPAEPVAELVRSVRAIAVKGRRP